MIYTSNYDNFIQYVLEQMELISSNGTTDYNKLINKPSIAGKELVGNVELSELNINPLNEIEVLSAIYEAEQDD